MKNKKILVLGDCHCPYADLDVLEEARKFGLKKKVDLIIQMGDLVDFKALSRFPKAPEDDSAFLEHLNTSKQVREIEKMFPKLFLLEGNHCKRLLKKASESGIPKEMIKSFKDTLGVKNWVWHEGTDPFEYNGTIFIHGDELSGSVRRMVELFGCNVVKAHTHRAEIVYCSTFNKKSWGMDVACTANLKGKSFAYANSTISKSMVGYGYIENNSPFWFPKGFNK